MRIFCFLLASLFAYPQMRLMSFAGRVEVNPSSSIEWDALSIGDKVEHNSTIKTSLLGKAKFCAHKGQCVVLEEQSRLLYNYTLLQQVRQYERSFSGFRGKGIFDFRVENKAFASRIYAGDWVLLPENALFDLEYKENKLNLCVHHGFIKASYQGKGFFVQKQKCLQGEGVDVMLTSHFEAEPSLQIKKAEKILREHKAIWKVDLQLPSQNLSQKMGHWLKGVLQERAEKEGIQLVFDKSLKIYSKKIIVELSPIRLQNLEKEWKFQMELFFTVLQEQSEFVERKEFWAKTVRGEHVMGSPSIMRYLPLDKENALYKASFLKEVEKGVVEDLWQRMNNPFFGQ